MRIAATILAASLWLGACASASPAAQPLVIGVTQRGGASAVRADGPALLSEAYLLHRDGKVALTENYADVPMQRRLHATERQTRTLFSLLNSATWKTLAEDPPGSPAADDVEITVETEGKSVTRWSSAQEPIFREVVHTLAEIRRGE